MERENSLNYLSAFALGGITGAVLALLYAPQSGEETRQIMRDKIRRGAERGRETLREGAEYARDKAQQGVEYGRQVAQRVVGKGQELADEAMEYAETAANEVSSFGERRRKPRTVASEFPEQS
jgi:gas vesicle protein